MLPIADGSDIGRLASQSARFLQRRRLAALARPCGQRVQLVVAAFSEWTDRADRRHAALFLSAIAGADPRNPLSIRRRPRAVPGTARQGLQGCSRRLVARSGGYSVRVIRRVVNGNRKVFEDSGCVIEEAEPDFTGIDEAFPRLRYVANHSRYAPLIRQRPEWVKDTIKFEVAQAERAGGADISRALARQAQMFNQSREFFNRYAYFILPVTQVEPFDVNTPYPTEIAGIAMETYIDWMRSCWDVTVMSNPAISVPAGFSATGLPVGLQIVGRHRDESSVLQLAHAFEQATRHQTRRPSLLGGR